MYRVAVAACRESTFVCLARFVFPWMVARPFIAILSGQRVRRGFAASVGMTDRKWESILFHEQVLA